MFVVIGLLGSVVLLQPCVRENTPSYAINNDCDNLPVLQTLNTMNTQPRLLVIAGPCVIESREIVISTAEYLYRLSERFNIALIFKASYKKANRTSLHSFVGIDRKQALDILASVRERFGIPVLTDVHESWEAEEVAQYVDILQIPAFLCRQTDLLLAAGRTGKPVNIKKGQFAAPEDMCRAVEKVRSTGNKNIMVCERGTTFGYHDLVVDMRSLIRLRACGVKVIYDATHSLQQPSIGEVSGGLRQYVLPLARAAVAVGVDGVFFETHPNPAQALSDAATQVPLDAVGHLLEQITIIHELIQSRLWNDNTMAQ